MKALACEMCGSNDVVKQDGLYVCQHCNTKYTLEEARKLMIEGKVDVTGSTIKVDNTDELENLYELARRAVKEKNTENAEKYYNQILIKDPRSWEATFYQVYFNAMNCAVGEIDLAANKLINCFDSVFALVNDNVPDEETATVLFIIVEQCIEISDVLFGAAKHTYDTIVGDDVFKSQMLCKCVSVTMMLYVLGELIEQNYDGNPELQKFAVFAWQHAIEKDSTIYKEYDIKGREISIKQTDLYAEKIKKYDASYKKPEFKAGGCYIATCVYGSYDCSEVWVLRRFRDEVLDRTFFGKFFINVYYFVSPKVVKIFGENKVFRSVCRKSLDNLINVLKKKGFDDTPYKDLY